MNPSPSLAAAAPVGRRRPSHAPALATIAGAVLLPSLVMLAWILVRNGGHLTYPLDAPYTQLALAEQLARGHYGLNPGEPSSPSSSIAWPFLLAALSFLPLGDAAPLLLCLCLASNLTTGGLLYALALECGVRVDRLRPPALAAIALSLTLALNLAGLAATGLEHSLHVALTLASLLGLVRFVRRDRVDGWWLAAIVALPLVRFEAAAALAADILVLLAFRKYAHALGVALAGAAAIGGFARYLHSMGLPPLPSSVWPAPPWQAPGWSWRRAARSRCCAPSGPASARTCSPTAPRTSSPCWSRSAGASRAPASAAAAGRPPPARGRTGRGRSPSASSPWWRSRSSPAAA